MRLPLTIIVALGSSTIALSATVFAAPQASVPAPRGTAKSSPPTPSAPNRAPAGSADEASALPPLPETPAGIEQIMVARPFVVMTPWASDWCEERTTVERGWVVILRVAHEYAVPRQTAEPILFAGARTVERVRNAPEANLILAIIPATPRTEAVPGHAAGAGGTAPIGAEDQSMRPLAELAIWFGTPGLPEQVDRAILAHEVTKANAASIKAQPLEDVVRALKQGGPAIAAFDREALLAEIAPWANRNGVSMIDAPEAAPNAAPSAPPSAAPKR